MSVKGSEVVLFLVILSCIGHFINAATAPILILHGGAGTISEEHAANKKIGMIRAIRAGYKVLLETDNVMDAVEKTVNVLEDDSAFNAGKGSVRTDTGEVEMDAIIINGTSLAAGAVGAIRHVANPISVARCVMEKTDHVFLVGNASETFAHANGFPFVPTEDLIANKTRMMEPNATIIRLHNHTHQAKNSDYDVGTVGAVAINTLGQLATATSTGGMSGKMEGRIGDSPIVGAGSLADDDIAGISATGSGEAFIRYRVASRIADLIDRGQMNASQAILTVLQGMTNKIPEADGGVIAITKSGEIGFEWNSEQMAWAYVKDEVIHYGVNRGEHFTEPWIIPTTTTTRATTTTRKPTTSTKKGTGTALNIQPVFTSILFITISSLIFK